MKDLIKKIIEDYYSISKDPRASDPSKIIVDHFCSDEYNSNLCANLVLNGEKTASSSLKSSYNSESEKIPQINSLVVITDWNGFPTCIIEITEVSESKFSEVTTEFAFTEGEGDKTLAWWREVHWKYFSAECKSLGIEPCENMILILEKFKVVYKNAI